MSNVAEIERAIEGLGRDSYRELERWWDEYRERQWDSQISTDSAPGGRLGKLLARVDEDIDSGRTTEFLK